MAHAEDLCAAFAAAFERSLRSRSGAQQAVNRFQPPNSRARPMLLRPNIIRVQHPQLPLPAASNQSSANRQRKPRHYAAPRLSSGAFSNLVRDRKTRFHLRSHLHSSKRSTGVPGKWAKPDRIASEPHTFELVGAARSTSTSSSMPYSLAAQLDMHYGEHNFFYGKTRERAHHCHLVGAADI